jgi:hypothetical protein
VSAGAVGVGGGVGGVGGAGGGAGGVGGQVQTYQTHIFAPPVTGAPVKKSKFTQGSADSRDHSGPGGACPLPPFSLSLSTPHFTF